MWEKFAPTHRSHAMAWAVSATAFSVVTYGKYQNS